ncbi:MAG: DHA2 family efflux MFS transporter permease subunit, partial [Eggerthellaceae bacterium]|nr:DHA2 family efflux MFS transporter permease subunit [Eggerthellaceae bacterium]
MNLTKDQIKTVAILLSGTFLAVLNITLLMTALPTIMVDMNIDAPTAQWLSSAYGMTEAIVIPMSAYIMGKLSTRKLYAGGLAVFAFGSFLGAISPIFPVLLAGRILQAAATGALMPAVMSLVLLTFPREKRGSGMGIVSLIIGFAPSIGPTLSGFLVDTIGWRYMFVLSGVLAVIIIIASLFILKNQDVFKATNFDIASVLMSSVGLFTLLYGLSHVTSSQIVAIPLAMIIVGVVVMILFLLRQRRLESPMLQVSVLESGRYRVAAIVMFCVMAALVGIDVMLPLYAQNVLGLSAARTGLIMMPGALLGAFVGMIAGRLFDKLGARPVAITGATLVLASSLGMLLLFNDHTNVWVITGVFMLLS